MNDYCHVSHQIAEHCNDEAKDYCYDCENLITEDDEFQEIKTRDNGYQFVCEDCKEEYTEMWVL